jgi:dTDP-4-dehydrorhamnose 3,5-epimerase
MADDRGSLSRLFCADELAASGWAWPVAQINHTVTLHRGAVRGFHFQRPPHAEAKLVSCLRGAVWDVAVDLRQGSPTFLQHRAIELSADNGQALLIPPGFAHGFQALRDGLVDRVVPATTTVTDFLRQHEQAISRFVLLDHMDWMSGYDPLALQEEWDMMLARSRAGTRILFRSAHSEPAYLSQVTVGGTRSPLRQSLHFHDDWARALTREDRVHTYAGFHIADVLA